MGTISAVGPDAVRLAFEAAGQVMFEYDATTGALVWSDAENASTVLGLKEAANIDSFNKLIARMSPEDAVQRDASIKRAHQDSESYQVEYSLHTDKNSRRWVEERGNWLKIGGVERLIGVIRIIDEQKNREARLSYLATYDELTGQLNRARTREILRERLHNLSTSKNEAAYLLIGVDNLGGINADFGFDVADEVIVEISRRLKSVLGRGDALGRVAGTKFGVVLGENDPDIRTICTALLGIVRASIIDTAQGGIASSVCIGVAPINDKSINADIVMSQAEAALDKAKRIGASSWTTYAENSETTTLRRQNTELSDVILTALNDRRVCLAYQPIVSDLNEEVKKYECLIRMQELDGSEIGAPKFIPAAERLGLVHLLDRRVLELATQTLHKAEDVALNVNISWETVKDPVWAEGYLAHLRANRDVADRITVELTETQVVDAIEASVEFVSAIKEVGCHFAIDDFGAGYTSFRNLKALDIDVLKIDGSFVTGVSSSRENQLFVRTLLDLARNFEMKTVAEWVDNDADAMLLKGLGVDYLQGFYIGKPVQIPEWSDEVPQRSIAAS